MKKYDVFIGDGSMAIGPAGGAPIEAENDMDSFVKEERGGL